MRAVWPSRSAYARHDSLPPVVAANSVHGEVPPKSMVADRARASSIVLTRCCSVRIAAKQKRERQGSIKSGVEAAGTGGE
jgi:hypothetical protein